MKLNIVDAIIILIILLGGVIGFKEGIIKKLTSVIGLILVVILSFTLKNYLSVIFYEMLAFLIIASVLTLVYRLLLGVSGLIEKILKATIILSIPSKILGFFAGLLENYIWVYLFLFVLTLPVINIKEIRESNLATSILEKTPILSKYTNKTLAIYNDLYNIIDNKENKTNEQVNESAMDLMLKYEIITPSSARKLIDKNKVSVSDDSFIDKYQ